MEGDGGQGRVGASNTGASRYSRVIPVRRSECRNFNYGDYSNKYLQTSIMNSKSLENFISKAEAACVIGTTRQTVSNLVRRGHFTTKVVAGQALVLRSEVEKYVPRPKGRPPKGEVTQKEPSKTIHKEDSKKYLSQAEAARHRGVSKQAVAALIQRGRLTPVEVAGRIVVLRSEIEGFVARPKFGNPPKNATSKKAPQKARPKK